MADGREKFMYRRAAMLEQERVAQDQFITRFGSLPVVNSAWGHACDIYQRTKDHNALLRATCNLAEGGVNTVVATTKPLVHRYQPQLEQVNTYACEKLALVEESYPIITRPTDEVMTEGKERCLVMVKPVTDSVTAKVNTVCNTYNGIKNKGQQTVDAAKGKVVAVRDYGLAQVNKSLGTSVGVYALEKVHEALTTSDGFVEKYLPQEEDEAPDGGQGLVNLDQQQQIDEHTLEGTVTRVQALTTKVRRRMYKRAMRDLHGLKMRSTERIRNFNFTIDLIQYARNAKDGLVDMKDTLEEKYEVAQNTVIDIWTQINDDPFTAPQPETTGIDVIAIATARRLVYEIKKDVAATITFVRTHGHPRAMLEKLEFAYNITVDIFEDLMGIHSLEDVGVAQGQAWQRRTKYTLSALEESFNYNFTEPLTGFGRRVGLLQSSGVMITDPSPADRDDLEMEPLEAAADSSKSEDDSDRSE